MRTRPRLADHHNLQPVMAGLVCAMVGFTSSFPVVLTGLRAVGATDAQAASGLAVLSMAMGLGCVLFSWRERMPITIAWSTPGAALLATAVAPRGGFGAAVGAFMVTGVLLALTGLVPWLSRLVRTIPTSLANAMLAGVLLPLCLAPVSSIWAHPATLAPIALVWLLLLRLAPRWAVPGALAAGAVVMTTSGTFARVDQGHLVPSLVWTMPSFDLATIVAVAVPLWLVTMTSQNIPGVAVMAGFGYHVEVKQPLVYTGVATVAGAGWGGHAINLAAISAALAAGPEAGDDRDRRWIAGVSCGLLYLLFGPLSAAVAAVAAAAPAGLVPTMAGLALVATLASSASSAFGSTTGRVPAAVCFLVAASGVAVAGIGAAFWGLAAGLVVHGWLAWRNKPSGTAAPSAAELGR